MGGRFFIGGSMKFAKIEEGQVAGLVNFIEYIKNDVLNGNLNVVSGASGQIAVLKGLSFDEVQEPKVKEVKEEAEVEEAPEEVDEPKVLHPHKKSVHKAKRKK